jgi:glycosyltransferase involved in cell wall biosynthesis
MNIVKQITLISDYYHPFIGGAEIVSKNLAERIAERGIKVNVVTSKTYVDSPKIDRDGNLTVRRISIPRFIHRFWFLIFSIIPIIQHPRNSDIIHGSNYGGALPAIICAKLLKKPCVLTVHEFMGKKWYKLERNYFKASFYHFAEKIIAKLPFDKFVAVSEYTKSQLLSFNIDAAKVSRIYNGFHNDLKLDGVNNKTFRNELKIPENTHVFMSYGRAGISKGISFYVEAIPKIIQEKRDTFFILIHTKSDRNEWNKIQSILESISSDKYLFIEGTDRRTLAKFLSVADTIVIPSMSEGFGYNILEAASNKKNIVTTNVGSIPEVVFGQYNYANESNHISIAEECIKAAKGQFTYSKESKIFNWSETIDSYIKLYDELSRNN